MKHLLCLAAAAVMLLSGCATTQTGPSSHASSAKVQQVRTTAYTHSERGHRRYGTDTACGTRLSSQQVKSAASDWSRFPVGTKFRIVETGEIYCVDDYGSALVGTGTIDLYKPSRSAMNSWGVRHVHIEIIEWGSTEKSLQILGPRTRYWHVRQMVSNLRNSTKQG